MLPSNNKNFKNNFLLYRSFAIQLKMKGKFKKGWS